MVEKIISMLTSAKDASVKAFDSLQAKAAEVGASMLKSFGAAVTSAFDKAAKGISNVQTVIDGVQAVLDQLASKASQGAQAFTGLGAAAGSAVSGLVSKGMASLDGLNSKLQEVGASMFKGLGSSAATTFQGAVDSAAAFESAMDRVQVATGSSAEEMAALTKAATDAGLTTQYSGVQAAGALESLAQAGLTAQESIATLPAVLNLAQAGGMELSAASEAVTKAVSGMGLQFEDAGRVADVLAKGSVLTGTSIGSLAETLGTVGPAAGRVGLSLESTVAMIGQFSQAGTDAGKAGSAFNTILGQFADPASAFRKELGEAGIVTDDFEQALQQLAGKGPEGAQAIKALGTEAGPVLSGLLSQGMGSLNALSTTLGNASGSAADMAATMSDNLNGSVKGFENVWEGVKTTLGTPVLPVLKEAVDAVAEGFRTAVADGAIGRFGESIAAAFRSGLEFAKGFISTIDFKAVGEKLQAFADQAKDALTRVQEYGTNTGNVLKIAWGTMSAGVNGVMTVIYGLGAVFAEIASGVSSGIAWLNEQLAKVSFGQLSQSFKQAAQDAEVMAGGFGASAQAMRDKAAESLQAVADAAQTARNGFTGLVQGSQEASTASGESERAFRQMAASIEETGRKSMETKVALESTAASTATASQSVSQLRAEYQQLMAGGNLQAAAEKLQEIDRIQRALPDSAQSAQKAAAVVDKAYVDLGMTSGTALQELAKNSQLAFSQLEQDGTQSASRMADAFKVMAERVIAANGGIAPEWLKTKAAVQGFEVEVDKAGKSTLRMKDAADSAKGSKEQLTRAVNDQRTALERLNAEREREIAAQEKANELKERELELYRKKWKIDKENYSLNTAGERVTMSFHSRTSVLELAKSQGLDEAAALRIVDQFEQQFDRKPGVLGGIQGGVNPNEVNAAIAEAVLAQTRAKVAKEAEEQRKAALPAKDANLKEAGATSRVIDLRVNGKSLGNVNTDADGEAAIDRLLSELERSKALAGA